MMICFMSLIEDDYRISHVHISIYASLWKLWIDEGRPNNVTLSMASFKKKCKISSCTTFYKTIRELHEYGYIDYSPSFNHNQGSCVRLIKLFENINKTGRYE